MEELCREMVSVPFFNTIGIQVTFWLIRLRNRGELSEGWYDPTTFQKAVQSDANESRQSIHERQASPPQIKNTTMQPGTRAEEESDSDDSIGPALPGREGISRSRRAGPSIPNMDDVELKRGALVLS